MSFKKTKDIRKLKLIANSIRQDIVKMLVEAGSGHSAGPLGMADVFTAIYFNVMNHNPNNPTWKNRDRFILSNGHICPVWYAALANSGYFPVKELKTLRKIGTRLHGHPHIHAAPGIENSAGPLGQGISMAAGIALGAKMDKKKFRVYCSMGDGEINEGQPWEAFMFAAKNKLDNLIAFVDRNYIQIDGDTEDIMPLDPLAKKFSSFNWNVIEIDGNDMKQVLKAFAKAKKNKGKPSVIIVNTIPGKGVSFIEGKYEWHGKPPTKEQGDMALAELRKVKNALGAK
jgi:transketolase|tara:strand:+ start:1008 stop:1862 length:855 start_codon:yes stop_codon:yes gene_type:complete